MLTIIESNDNHLKVAKPEFKDDLGVFENAYFLYTSGDENHIENRLDINFKDKYDKPRFPTSGIMSDEKEERVKLFNKILKSAINKVARAIKDNSYGTDEVIEKARNKKVISVGGYVPDELKRIDFSCKSLSTDFKIPITIFIYKDYLQVAYKTVLNKQYQRHDYEDDIPMLVEKRNPFMVNCISKLEKIELDVE